MTSTDHLEDAARQALQILCHQAFVEIRASAFTRSVISMSDAADEECDHDRWVRRLADTCAALPAVLACPPQEDAKALQDAWDRGDALTRCWIRDILAWEGIRIEDLVDTAGPPTEGPGTGTLLCLTGWI